MPFGPFAPKPPLDVGPFDSLNQQRAEASPDIPASQSPTPNGEKSIILKVPALSRFAGPFGFSPIPPSASPFVAPQQSPFSDARPIVPTRPALGRAIGVFGPFWGLNRPVVDTTAYVNLTQQTLEIINSGDPASQFVRLTQQALEVINSGDPASQNVRLSQQYLEVISTFGTPPVQGKGKKDNGPGRTKGGAAGSYVSFKLKEQRDKASRQGRFNNNVIAFLPQQYLTPGPPAKVKWIEDTKVVKLN